MAFFETSTRLAGSSECLRRRVRRCGLGVNRVKIALNELKAIKEEWGVSIAAIMKRAANLGLVTQGRYKTFCIVAAKNGWRAQEPGRWVGEEKSGRFEPLVLRALAQELITTSKAAGLLGISLRELARSLKPWIEVRIAVQDANVFIDLESMGLLDLWFDLGHETITSDDLAIELEDGNHVDALTSIRLGKVRAAVISAEEMDGGFGMMQSELENSGLSVADISVLFLAIREDAMLLSGDKQLKHQAGVRSVEVHGTLWILDQLVAARLLIATTAAEARRTNASHGRAQRRYLPRAECESRIRRWR